MTPIQLMKWGRQHVKIFGQHIDLFSKSRILYFKTETLTFSKKELFLLHFFFVSILTISLTCCGDSQSRATAQPNVKSFKSSTPKHPAQSVVNEIVEYNKLSNGLTVTHTQTDANATVLDTNIIKMAPEKKDLLDTSLQALELSSYKDDYTWNGYSSEYGASASDGPYMNIYFTTDVGSKNIHIDTTDISILPKPLLSLYEQLLTLDF